MKIFGLKSITVMICALIISCNEDLNNRIEENNQQSKNENNVNTENLNLILNPTSPTDLCKDKGMILVNSIAKETCYYKNYEIDESRVSCTNNNAVGPGPTSSFLKCKCDRQLETTRNNCNEGDVFIGFSQCPNKPSIFKNATGADSNVSCDRRKDRAEWTQKCNQLCSEHYSGPNGELVSRFGEDVGGQCCRSASNPKGDEPSHVE